ncbi:MAG TPA: TetR/AcrR family transcriptional regulator [Candidatus Saccharimonadales bacterium]|nr:TetR/AcrR family transcriptional regulator [Candidatus Saccharimonadales bacterium]
MQENISPTKEKLLHTAVELMLFKGYNATGVDEICKTAGTTKGSFFHYFPHKEDLGTAVLDYFWKEMQTIVQQKKFQKISDPLKLLFAYLDSFYDIAKNPSISWSCLFGNFAQEIAPNNPIIRKRCEEGFATWENMLATCIETAKKHYAPTTPFNALNLAKYFIATFEGSLLLAKASEDTTIVAENIRQYKQYIELLLTPKGGGNY